MKPLHGFERGAPIDEAKLVVEFEAFKKSAEYFCDYYSSVNDMKRKMRHMSDADMTVFFHNIKCLVESMMDSCNPNFGQASCGLSDPWEQHHTLTAKAGPSRIDC